MEPLELYMTFDSLATLDHELDQNLRLGRAFIQLPGCSGVEDGPEVLADCSLILVHPSNATELSLSAQIVMVSAAEQGIAVGVELRPFDASVAEAIRTFASEPPPEDADATCDGAVSPPAQPACAPACADEAGGISDVTQDTAEPDDGAGEDGGEPATHSADDELDLDEHLSDRQSQTRPAQLRRLSYNDQQKVARTGILSDRVTLERLYGKSVWRSLLENPKLTIPEVARIARKGTVPRPLIELILENNAWIHATPVRRALMSNPKLTPEGVVKLLRITPRHELKTIHRGTAYSPYIREQARKLLV